MTISQVSSTSVTGTSVTMPSHQAGDLLIISARRASNTAASLPAGWTNIQAAGANTLSLRTGYKIAASGSETSGTWTNASHLTVSVFRSSTGTLLIGASNTANNSSNSNLPYPSLTLLNHSGSSAIYRAGTRAAATANVATPPTNYTLIVSEPATPVMAAHYRLAQSADATADNVAMGSTGTHRAHSVEIIEYVEGTDNTRDFDGTDDDIQMAVADNSGFTHGTLAVLFKMDALVEYRTLAGFHDSGGGLVLDIFVASHSGGVLGWYNGTTEFTTSPIVPTGVWCLAVIRKASGTTAMRTSMYRYDRDAWEHAATSTFAPGSSPGASGTIRFSAAGDEHWNGPIAVRALWTNALPWTADASGDSAIEAAGLETAAQNWADVSPAPTSLWRFNQASTATSVLDDTDSADQSAITGTSVIANSPSGFDFSLDTGITGTLAVTEENDTVSASGTFTPPPITGTLAQTEANDTLAASGTNTPPPISGSLSETEDDDTLAASGTSTPPSFTGTLAQTEANDTLSASGTSTPPSFTGTVSVTEQNDTLAASGTSTPPSFTGTVNVTEQNDTLAASGSFTGSGISGSVNVTEADDTLSASGISTPPSFTGTLSVTEANDTLAASGTATPPTVTGTVSVTEQNDTLAAAGTSTPPPITGTLAVTEQNDTLAASGFVVEGEPAQGQVFVVPARSRTVRAPTRRTLVVGSRSTRFSVPLGGRTFVRDINND